MEIIYKKIDDVFDEEYKVEASAKIKETKEARRKKIEEKKVEGEKKGEERHYVPEPEIRSSRDQKKLSRLSS